VDVDPLADPEADRPEMRFNDGAVGPGGRFWAGTMNVNEDPEGTDGVLYRLDPDGSVQRMDDGFSLSNGLGWSPDRRTLYFTDTFRRAIYAYDYDPATGAVAGRRPWVEIPEGDGYPDGLTVDAEGGVWSARYGGWKVVRFDPQGRVDREVRLPVAHVTSCILGGPDLTDLYVTTAWEFLTAEQRAAQPQAGDLFRVRVEVPGLPEYEFAG
jgi:sugar lactone lactonase YvrE